MKRQHGFTILELIAVTVLIGLLVMLLLPAVQAAREAARRMSCQNNFRQIGLAIHHYHAAYGVLPRHKSGTGLGAAKSWDDHSYNSNCEQLSVFVGVLPFLEQEAMWEAISTELSVRASENPALGMSMFEMAASLGPSGEDEVAAVFPPMGVTPHVLSDEIWMNDANYLDEAGGGDSADDETADDDSEIAKQTQQLMQIESYWPWHAEVPTLRCPSDPGIGLPSMGRTNYAACLGDSGYLMSHGARDLQLKPVPLLASRADQTQRGVFMPHQSTRLSDITDGLSSTLMMGEIATDLGDLDTRTAARVVGDFDKDLASRPLACASQRDRSRPMFWEPGVTTLTDKQGRGFRWASGNGPYTGMQTITAPNSPSCVSSTQGRMDAAGKLSAAATADLNYGLLPASSRHQGGCHVMLADGAIRFVSNSIQAGNASAAMIGFRDDQPTDTISPQPSPYGLWGALGTRAEEELVGWAY